MTEQDLTIILSNVIINLPKMKHRLQLVSMKHLEGKMKYRIFNKGLATDMSKIGTYSERPLSVLSPAINPKGWAVPSAFKGKGRTQFFPKGYKEFRKAQGFQTNYVDTDYTGSLRLSLQTGLAQGDIVLGFSDQEQYDKALKLEEHFNKTIYEPTPQEEQEIDNIVLNELSTILDEFGL